VELLLLFFSRVTTEADDQSSLHCVIVSTDVMSDHSPVRYVFSLRIFGDFENYTFLETLGPTESEKQC